MGRHVAVAGPRLSPVSLVGVVRRVPTDWILCGMGSKSLVVAPRMFMSSRARIPTPLRRALRCSCEQLAPASLTAAFSDERQRRKHPGRSRRNLSRSDKDVIAARLPPTTVFDIFWRLRKKANYGDADVFVLGASGEADARRLAESLMIVTDATVASVEVLIAAYAGTDVIAEHAARYHAKKWTSTASPIARRVESWQKRSRTSVR